MIAAGKAAAQKLAHALNLLKADAADGGSGWADDRIADYQPRRSRSAPPPSSGSGSGSLRRVWHVNQRVRAWIRSHNRKAKREGGVRIVACLGSRQGSEHSFFRQRRPVDTLSTGRKVDDAEKNARGPAK